MNFISGMGLSQDNQMPMMNYLRTPGLGTFASLPGLRDELLPDHKEPRISWARSQTKAVLLRMPT